MSRTDRYLLSVIALAVGAIAEDPEAEAAMKENAMKKHIARWMRQKANKLDPQPAVTPWPPTTVSTAANSYTVTYR